MRFLKKRKLLHQVGEESWMAGPLGHSPSFGLSLLRDLQLFSHPLCFLALASTTKMLILEIPLN